MRRPPADSPHNVHSAGRVVHQPGMPEFWVPLGHTLLSNMLRYGGDRRGVGV